MVPARKTDVDQDAVDAYAVLCPCPMPTWKRTTDIVVATLALIILWPLMLLIAIAVKLGSRGPVIFRQTRVGLQGREFSFLKFRTMEIGNDSNVHLEHVVRLITDSADGREAPMRKLVRDPRITPGGRFLRASCLDEIPQIISVLRGEMSIVGPRPPITYEAAEYDAWQRGRLAAVPGMTGLWQVSGKNRLSFTEMAQLDIDYARNLSFLRDIAIILKTPGAILLSALDGDGSSEPCDEKGQSR